MPRILLGWRSAVPVMLLLVVAATQLMLVRVHDLSRWKGGGFGMFSTVDDAPHRWARIVVLAPDRAEEVEMAPSIAQELEKALTLPSPARLQRLCDRVVARERRYGRPVSGVRVTVWRLHLTPDTLAPSRLVLREYTHDVAP